MVPEGSWHFLSQVTFLEYCLCFSWYIFGIEGLKYMPGGSLLALLLMMFIQFMLWKLQMKKCSSCLGLPLLASLALMGRMLSRVSGSSNLDIFDIFYIIDLQIFPERVSIDTMVAVSLVGKQLQSSYNEAVHRQVLPWFFRASLVLLS